MSTDARVARHFSGARSLAPRLCPVDDSANVPDRTRERDARANASSPRGHGRGRCRYRSRAVVTHRNFSTALFRTRESCDTSRRFGRGRREPSPDQSKYPHERNAERNRNARPETRKFDESNPSRIRARWSNDVDVGCTKRAFPKCSSSSLECSARESPSSDVLGVVDPPLDHSTSAMASASASDADGGVFARFVCTRASHGASVWTFGRSRSRTPSSRSWRGGTPRTRSRLRSWASRARRCTRSRGSARTGPCALRRSSRAAASTPPPPPPRSSTRGRRPRALFAASWTSHPRPRPRARLPLRRRQALHRSSPRPSSSKTFTTRTRRRVPPETRLSFSHRRRRFRHLGDGAFAPPSYPDGERFSWYSRRAADVRAHTSADVIAARRRYGANVLDIPSPSFGQLLAEQLAAPFFAFQVFCCALWCADEYWYYSLCTLAMLVVCESLTALNRRRTVRDMRRLEPTRAIPAARRDGRWGELDPRRAASPGTSCASPSEGKKGEASRLGRERARVRRERRLTVRSVVGGGGGDGDGGNAHRRVGART